jgi:hypothetical protein
VLLILSLRSLFLLPLLASPSLRREDAEESEDSEVYNEEEEEEGDREAAVRPLG